MVGSSHGVGGVWSVVSMGRHRLGQREREEVQAVVVDHVHVLAPPQLQHHLEVRVVLPKPRLGQHRDVRPGRVAELERSDGELTGVERGVAAGTGEEGDVDAALAQTPDEMPGQRLEPAGEGLASGCLEAARITTCMAHLDRATSARTSA